uniref:Uncharacterized protein n=1 Tax=Rhizophora mucronata TaxID=61149 RepID=A0A2P2PBX0_RHIMU
MTLPIILSDSNICKGYYMVLHLFPFCL